MKHRNRTKITFVATSFDGTYEDGAEFLLRISDKLVGDFDMSYVTVFKTIHQIFGDTGRECCYIPDELKKYPINNLEQELKEMEDKYETTLEEIMVGDFDQYHSNRKRAQETLLRFFRFWEDYLDKENPDYIIGTSTRYVNLVGHAVCKKRKTKFLIISPSPFPDTFRFTEDIRGHISTLDRYWQMNSRKKLSAEERRKVEKYINSIIRTKKRFFQADSTPRINLAKLKFFLERAYKSFFIERLRTPYSKPWRGAYKYTLKIIRSKLTRILYLKPDYNEKYIFFPLHVEWDSPILVWNPLFINQLFLIKIISRALPSDVTLYVKEHINDVGGTPFTQLKRIRDTPKVKLINPPEDSHKIIRNSEAVLVIAGTPGWEALLMGKSVINVGGTYYETSGLTWDVKDLTQLGSTIKKAIKENKADKETLYRFIAAFQKVIYPGRIYFTQLYYSNKSNRDFVLSEENINNVAEGIKKQITENAYLLRGEEIHE